MAETDVIAGIKEVHHAMGNVLNNWSWVEIELSGVFAGATNMGGRKDEHIFNAIISFETRIAVCGKAVEVMYGSPEKTALWEALASRLMKYYKRRHRIAHSTLARRDGVFGIEPFMQSTNLYEPVGDVDPTIFAPQITEMSDSFAEMRECLAWLKQNAFNQPKLDLKSLAQGQQQGSLLDRVLTSAILKLEQQQPPPKS